MRNIVILGGGSAGWLTAGVIASEHDLGQDSGLTVTLVESPDVKTIGVGEGTWPSMRDTLRRMGVSESEFIVECDAAFKQASRFAGWVTGDADDVYYHPFSMPAGFGECNIVPAWSRLAGRPDFADVASFQPQLCEQGRGPKQARTPEFAAVANYAYHLDAGKFGEFLKRHCIEKLGVRYLQAHVEAVESRENGDIAGLRTTEAGLVSGDLFIDCTGFASLLLGKHYGVPLVGTSDTLFCDTALAVQVPYERASDPVACHTLATARAGGWIWDIGLPTRRGVGHVFSSAHWTLEEAEKSLVNYVEATSGQSMDSLPAPRRIDLRPGYRKEFWHRNCVAVGISAGFVEPLEASALALIELSARMISSELPASRSVMDLVARRFNERFTYRWTRIVDFLKLHYMLSRREDSAFWRDNRSPESVPDRLQELLELWRYRPPGRGDFPEIEEIFPAASYQYVLYGMGFEPEPDSRGRRDEDRDSAMRWFQHTARLTRQYMSGLPPHRDLLEQVRERGFPAARPETTS